MEMKNAIEKLNALASEPRLTIFRLLVRNGSNACNASEIAEHTDIPKSTLSFHLKELTQANLIIATKQGRFIFYTLNQKSLANFLDYLTEDCCQGRPELCKKDTNCC